MLPEGRDAFHLGSALESFRRNGVAPERTCLDQGKNHLRSRCRGFLRWGSKKNRNGCIEKGCVGMRISVICVVVFLLLGCSDSRKEAKHETEIFAEKPRTSRTVYTTSTDDIENVFNDTNYSLKHWNEGVREIPRIYLTAISSRWRTQALTMGTKAKKAFFFQLALPLILRSNELILQERKILLALAKKKKLEPMEKQ